MDKASTIKRRGEANEMITLARLHSDMNDTHSSPLISAVFPPASTPDKLYLFRMATHLFTGLFFC